MFFGVLAIAACSGSDAGGVAAATGPAGPQGPAGVSGQPAEAGRQGPQGDGGIQGPQGNGGIQGPQGDAGIRGSRGAGGRWLDANGNEVTVVEYDPLGNYIYFFDAVGHFWTYRTDLEVVYAAYSDGNRFYTSFDCSGPAYKSAKTPNGTLDEGNGVIIFRPPTVAGQPIAYNSFGGLGGGCAVATGSVTGVLLTAFQSAGATPVVAAPIYPVP
ncbi:MAG: hypothetical protein JWM82_2107 [Myxococcales bacterium]|nr:hypothetical protein [Myxococcales bacterium]